MISFAAKRPMLQTGHCVIADYDRQWLEHVLQDAAERAGTFMPMRREIAEAIMLYLESRCPLSSLPLEFLFARIKSMLEEVGLPLIAQHLRKQTPPVDISLEEIAAQSPLPLFFYTELRRRVEKLRQMGLNSYHFSGEENCSIALGSRRRECPTTRRELRELRGFLQEATA